MAVAFPLSPVPTQFGNVTYPRRYGVFYPGEAVTCTLSKAGATGYEVRNIWGVVVASGFVTGTSVAIAAPVGGWKLGWYRLYVTGPTNDAVFGTSYGASMFCVLNADARFPTAPAPSATSVAGSASFGDLIARPLFGHGPLRFSRAYPDVTVAGPFNLPDVLASLADDAANWWRKPSNEDPVHPRDSMVAFTELTVDVLYPPNGCAVYARDETIDCSQVFVAVETGTNVGVKITVRAPDANTIVATYDNQTTPAGIEYVTRNDPRVRVFASGSLPGLMAATAIGRSKWNGVVATVSACYPQAKFFEGPYNEPERNANYTEEAHRMHLFRGAVKAGNSGAQTLGPGSVSTNAGHLAWLDGFFAAGGGQWCDAISHHPYNNMTYDILQGRRTYEAWTALLTKYGLQTKVQWQTENGTVFTPVYGIYKPRRARWYLMQVLLMEQFGIPIERNIQFNDASHGFWAFPTWTVNGDGTVNPQGPLMRTLYEQRWGRTFQHRLDFGSLGDSMFLGSVYRGADTTGFCVVAPASAQINSKVVLSVTGTASQLVQRDCFGNSLAVLGVSGGKVTVPMPDDMPVYLDLPAGVDVQPYSINDRPPIANPVQALSLTGPYSGTGVDHTSASGARALDGKWQSFYSQDGSELYQGAAGVPAWLTVQFPQPRRFDRVTVWSGLSWQSYSRLIDFDIQTSDDGATWTTVKTVTRPAPSAFQHGSGGSGAIGGTGCQFESYDDEMRLYDLKLASPVTAKYARVYARAISAGGEPTTDIATNMGQGDPDPKLTLQQVGIYCDDVATPRYVLH